MSVRSDITVASGWYKHEAKTLRITVTDGDGVAVVLTDLGLLWRVIRDSGSPTVFLEKTDGAGITVTGAGNNIASIAIEAADYDDLDAGVHRHELWDTDNSLLLSYGDAWVLPASEPVATP